MARKSKCGQSRKGLHQNDEGHRDVIPWNEQTQRGRKQPGKRRIENEARLAKAVVGPLRPSRIQNSLLPLSGDVEPGCSVKFEIMTGGNAAPEEGRDDQQRNAKRKKER